MVRTLAVIVFLIGATAAVPVEAQQAGTALTPKQRERERKAMSAYAATRYQEALDLYADLYAEFRDPLYLRNIGRCHQKLRRPEEAIASFEEYLARYKRLTGSEIDEVKGWIEEMEELKKAMAAPAPAPVPAPAPPAPAPVMTPPAPAPVAAAPPVQVHQQAPPVDDRKNTTIRRIGWGAVIAGGALLVAGGVFNATSWSKFNSADGTCNVALGQCREAADSADTHILLSKIFFATGAAAGLTGGALFLLYPVTEPSRSAAISGMGASAAFSF